MYSVWFTAGIGMGGLQKNSPCLGAGAVKMMQAINHEEGIFTRKIRKTALNCHRPQSPTLLPITSLEFIVIMEGTSISSTILFLRWLLRDTIDADRSLGSGTKSSMDWIPE